MNGESCLAAAAGAGCPGQAARGDAMAGHLVTLAWIAQRWRCAPAACLQFLVERGALPVRICLEARHTVLGFKLFAVLGMEAGAGGRPTELRGGE